MSSMVVSHDEEDVRLARCLTNINQEEQSGEGKGEYLWVHELNLVLVQ